MGWGYTLKGGHERTLRFREPVWPSGKALGWEAEGPRFDPLRLSFLFSSKIVVYGHCLVTLSTQLMKTLKWLTQLLTLMQNHSGGDSVASRC